MAELSSSVIHKFVDLTSEEDESKGYYSYATGIVNGNDKYVQLDGSDTVASVSLATDLSTGDRVLVYIENHTATVVGNITYPTSGRAVIEINENLADFEDLTVIRLDALDLRAETIETNYIEAIYETVDYLLAEMITADYILAETIEANYATIYDLTVLKEYVDTLEASEITVEYLETNFADLNKFNALEGTVTYLESQMITTDELEANYAKIADLNVTNANVSNLEANYSDLKYVLAGYEVVEDLQSIHLTVDNVVIDNAVIQDAMIANVSADKLTAGTIYTSLVKIQTAENDTSLYLNDSLIQMREDDLVRFQAGKDATGEYGLVIWNDEGKVMFDATGATSDGIGKEVIVNDMVADTANIAGYKLDIASVAERLNEDGSLTIEAAQVTINGSTLDAWYAEVTETTTDLGTNMTALQTQFTIVQGQVDTVVSQTEILEGEVTSLSDQYAEIVVNVDSVTTQVKDLSSDYDTLTGEYTNLTSQVASIETTVNQVNITVSSLTSNYDTLVENVASLVTTTNSITASVSSVQEALNNIGGRNYLRDTYDPQRVSSRSDTGWCLSSGGNGTYEYVDVSTDYSVPVIGAMGIRGNTSGNRDMTQNAKYLVNGDTYTVSWYARVVDCDSVNMLCRLWNVTASSNNRNLYNGSITNTSWQKFTFTFTHNTSDTISIQFGMSGSGSIDICGMKIETGSVATDWSPAPEDNDYDTLTEEYTNLISQVASITTSVNNISIDVSSLTTNYGTLSSQVASINTDISSITASVSSIESQLSSAVIWNMCSGTSDDWTSYKVADGSNKTVYPLKFYGMNDAGLLVGDVIYVSFDVKYSDDFVASGTDTAGYGCIQGDCNTGGTWVSISMTGGNQKTNLQSIATGERISHISTYFKVTSAMIDGTYSGDWRVGFRFDYVTGTFYYKCAMANVGSSAATWNPSREDVADSVSEESVIEILKNNITLKTSSSTNGTASIVLSVDGNDVGDTTVVTGAAEAFENDLNSNNSSIILNAGSIAFNSGTITINSENFMLTEDGLIIANKGFIGGWEISNNSIYSNKSSLNGADESYGIYIGLDGIGLGEISNGNIKHSPIELLPDGSSYLLDCYLGKSFYMAAQITIPSEIDRGDFLKVFEIDEFNMGNALYCKNLDFIIEDHAILQTGSFDLNNVFENATVFYDNIKVDSSGDNMIELNNSSSGATGVMINGWSGYKVSLQVGSGGSNRGVYDDTASRWLIYSNSSNDTYLAYNNGTYRHYYRAGDSWNTPWFGAGYVSSSAANVYWTMLPKYPIVGGPTVKISGSVILRQDNKYTHGSSSSSYVSPSSWTVSNCEWGLRLYGTFSSTTNATNNSSIGINANLTITLS